MKKLFSYLTLLSLLLPSSALLAMDDQAMLNNPLVIMQKNLNEHYNPVIEHNDASSSRESFLTLIGIRAQAKEDITDRNTQHNIINHYNNALKNLLRRFPSTIITSSGDFAELHNLCIIGNILEDEEEYIDIFLARILIQYAPVEYITYLPSLLLEEPDLIQNLITRGIDLNRQDDEGKTVLHYFFESNDDIELEDETEIINALFPQSNRPYIDFTRTDAYGKSILELAQENPAILDEYPRLKRAVNKAIKQTQRARLNKAHTDAYQQLRLMR